MRKVACLLLCLVVFSACVRPAATLVPTVAPTLPSATALPTATATVMPSATTLPPTATPSATALPSPTATALPTPTATPPPPTHTPKPTAVSPTMTPTAPSEARQLYISSLIASPDERPILYAIAEGKAYRSLDRAASWEPMALDGVPSDAAVISIALDYHHPTVMYLCTWSGIYRREGDAAWSFVHPIRAYCLAVDWRDPNTLWIGAPYTEEYQGILMKSTDAGRTWGRADGGLPTGWGYDVQGIAFDPQDANIMYANVRTSGKALPPGLIYRGGSAGNWERLFPPDVPGKSSCWARGMALDPTLRRLYVGCDAYTEGGSTLSLCQSDNAFSGDSSQVTWLCKQPFTAWDFAAKRYFRVQLLAVDARAPKAIYATVTFYHSGIGDEQHLVVSHDDGESWQEANFVSH